MTIYCTRIRLRVRKRFMVRALSHMLLRLKLPSFTEGNDAADLKFYEASQRGFEILSNGGLLKASYRTIDSDEVLFITDDLTEEQFRDFDAQWREIFAGEPIREFVTSRLPTPVQFDLEDLAEIETHPAMTLSRTLEAGVAAAKRRLSATIEVKA